MQDHIPAEEIPSVSCSRCDTQIRDLPMSPHEKPTHQTLHSVKIILHDGALSDDPMTTLVTRYRHRPAIAFNTATMLIGCPGFTSPVAPS